MYIRPNVHTLVISILKNIVPYVILITGKLAGQCIHYGGPGEIFD